MTKTEYLKFLTKNLEDILIDTKFDNYKKQIFAWRLSASFVRTYKESYLWNRALYLSTNGCILLNETRDTKLAIKSLKESAEIYEYLSTISENYDKEYALILASLSYDIAGYQANAICLTRKVQDYSLTSIESDIDLTTDNYILQHIRQILLKNITIAKSRISTSSQLNTNLGLQMFNSAMSKWYNNILSGTENDYLNDIQKTYKYYLETSNLPISHILFLLKTRLKTYSERSIWANLSHIGLTQNPLWTKYIRLLTNDIYLGNRIKDIDNRISKFEFWTSQLRAIEKGLLVHDDNFVIQMPTSAGKTFIAELSILDHLIKNPSKKCIYIAPFRALTNEKENEMNSYLSKLGFSVSALSGSYEIDEFQQLILDDTDVLIATPEKIDLLFRLNPSYFESISLIVVDEGQIVGDISARSSLIEFLIIRLKIKLQSAKFLFISAVIKTENADQYSFWLSNLRTNVIRSLLHSDSKSDELWEPTRKLIGSFRWEGSSGRIDYKDIETEDEKTGRRTGAFIHSFLKEKQYGNLYPIKTSKAQTSAAIAFRLSGDGNCLIFCARVGDTKRVGEALLNILDILDSHSIPDYFKEDKDKESYFFAAKWYGTNTYISKCIARGIGVHFGDMPEPVRRAIESDYSSGILKILIATSTVGQGLNFPIKHIVVHSSIIDHRNNRAIRIKVSDFWNIIGRAGRAGKETEGQIIFVINSDFDEETYRHLTNKSNIEQAYSMFFNVLKALIDKRINPSQYEEFLQILSEPYLLNLLIDETVGTKDEEVINKIINNSLFKVQAEDRNIDIQPLRNSFLKIAETIRDKVPDQATIKIFGETGLSLGSNIAITEYVDNHLDELKIKIEEDNYLDLLKVILNLFDTGEIEEIKSNKLNRIAMKPSEFFNVLKLWVEGEDIDKILIEWRKVNNDINSLNILISDGYYYRYTWTVTAFITILSYKLNISRDKLPTNIRNLSNYVKFGINDPTACLARSLGIRNRDTAMLLSSISNGTSGKGFIKWLANLTWEEIEKLNINKYDKNNIIDTALKLNPNKYTETQSTLNFDIKGIPFSDERIKTSLIVKSGYKLLYQRDIENIYDPFAIKIFYKEGELGFVPREYSKLIATDIEINNTQYEIMVQKTQRYQNYNNITIKMYIKQ